jgi:hypothetical protein
MTDKPDKSEVPNLVVRAPSPTEAPRAIYLFGHLRPPAGSRLFVALRAQPIQRLIGAGAGWLHESIALFRVVCQPGVPRTVVSGPLIGQLEEWGRSNNADLLQCADLLPDEDEWSVILMRHGFHCVRSERFFQVPYHLAHNRVTTSAKRHQKDIPGTWRTESIRHHPPERVLNLVVQYRLLPPAELLDHWRTDLPFGFDLDMSSILLDGKEPIGTLLVRRIPNAFVVDVRVVICQNPRLRALGNLCLFCHISRRIAADGPIHWLEFRGGEAEHLETANLAIRMGGREVAQRRVLGKKLR